MRNKLFQFVWYFFVKPFVPRGSKTIVNPVIRNERRIRAQVRLAKMFGGIDGCMAGDSNGEVFARFSVMRKFSGLVINISQGGSTASDWIDYFADTTSGGRVYSDIMGDCADAIVWNIGGNYILLGRLDDAAHGITTLHRLFPFAWWCTIPPLYDAVLAALSKLASFPERDQRYYDEGTLYVNGIISTVCRPMVIDIYKAFCMVSGDPIPGALKDMVHFSNQAVTVIRRVVGGAI